MVVADVNGSAQFPFTGQFVEKLKKKGNQQQKGHEFHWAHHMVICLCAMIYG